MKSIRPALRDDIHVPAHRPAEFRLAAGRYHLELTHDVIAVKDPAQPRSIVVCRKTINDEVVRKITLAVDGEALARHSRGFREKLVARGVRGRDARNE